MLDEAVEDVGAVTVEDTDVDGMSTAFVGNAAVVAEVEQPAASDCSLSVDVVPAGLGRLADAAPSVGNRRSKMASCSSTISRDMSSASGTVYVRVADLSALYRMSETGKASNVQRMLVVDGNRKRTYDAGARTR